MLKSVSTSVRRSQLWIAIAMACACATAVAAAVAPAAPPPTAAASDTAIAPPATLDRIKSAGRLVLGYQTDARPLSYKDESGKPAGYSVTLCQKVADAVKANLGTPTLAVDWVAVTGAGTDSVRSGSIDVLCGATVASLTDRAVVSFSIPIFPGGVAGLVRTDAPAQFQDALEERPPPYQPLWRGSTPASIQALQRKTVSVVGGTPVVDLLVARMAALHINSTVAPVDSYAAGAAKVVDRSADMLVGDRAPLLDLAKRDAHASELKVLTRHFTYEPIALALRQDDDAFRLVIDRALSELYANPGFGDIYVASFGRPDAETTQFFRMAAVPK